jgi:hypothetical protein
MARGTVGETEIGGTGPAIALDVFKGLGLTGLSQNGCGQLFTVFVLKFKSSFV